MLGEMMISKHPELEDLLLWRTGELSAEDAEAIESHLKECPVCQNTLTGIKSDVTRAGNVRREAEPRPTYAASPERSSGARA